MAGYDSARIVEIVQHVASNTWTNCINEGAKTDVAFPVAWVLAAWAQTIATRRRERDEPFAGLVGAIRNKGCELLAATMQRNATRRHWLLPLVLRARVSACDNPFMQLLG